MVHIAKVMVFPVVMYEYESWTIKKAESQKNWYFWTVVLEKTLEQQEDQTSQSQRKSTLNIHWRDWCWSWNSSPLATWCEELTLWKRPWCWEKLRAGEGGDRRWDDWGWHHWLNGHEFEKTPGDSEGQEAWWAGVYGVAKSWTWLSEWTATNTICLMSLWEEGNLDIETDQQEEGHVMMEAKIGVK